MVGRERRRLARAFRLAMAAATGPAVMMACSGAPPDDPDAGVRDAGPFDATIDATRDASVDSAADAGSRSLDARPDTAKPVTVVDASVPDVFASTGCYMGATDLDSSFGVDGAPDGQDTCAYFLGCGLPTGLINLGCNVYDVLPDGGPLPVYGETCWIAEDAGCQDDVYVPGEGGAITLLCNPCFGGGGRRPAGLVPSPASGASPVAAYLAAMAFEEEASVTAFDRMEAELAAHGAPVSLVAAARRAKHDEVRHARAMASLARARGGEVRGARVRRPRARSAAAMAMENAAEGCVRETYGALLARWQADHAADPQLRRAFERIARDEAGHAALSHAVARWIEPRLDPQSRSRVARARARAVRALESAITEPDPRLARDAGLPEERRARALLSSLVATLDLGD